MAPAMRPPRSSASPSDAEIVVVVARVRCTGRDPYFRTFASDFASAWLKCPLISVCPVAIGPFCTLGDDCTTPSSTTAIALQPAVIAVEQDAAGVPSHAALVSAAQSLVPCALKSSATVQAPSWSTVAKAEETSRPATAVGPRTYFVFPSWLQARIRSSGRSSPAAPPVATRPQVSAV